MVYQDVTRNKNISASAKGLYAYLSAFCGVSDECYPSVDAITNEMGMGKDTFYRHINALVAAGVVQKKQVVGNDGKFGRTVYKLTHEVAIHDFPFPQNTDTVVSDTAQKETKSNNININNINNNNIICSEPDKSAPNSSGISLLLNDKTYYDVPLDKIGMWESTYPAVDVRMELNKMRAWLDSNPTRRKTRKCVERFINNWLSRTQDSGGSKGQKGVKETSGNNTYDSDASWERLRRTVAETECSFDGREDLPFK